MADSAPAVAAVSAPSRPLHRVLSTSDGLAIVIGVVIGAGILRTPGLIAGYVGTPWLILAIWVAGAVPAALAALVLAELGAMIPAAGGKYAYVRAAYGDAAAAFAGWGEVLLNRSFTGALKAVLIGEYLVLLAGRGSAQILGAGVALAFLFVHVPGVREGRRFQNVSTVLKVGLLFAIVGAGFVFGDGVSWQGGASAAPAQGLLLGIVLAMQSTFFTYYGSEASLQMAEEMREPGRAVPRMLLLGVGSVTALYLLINAAMLHALPPSAMAGSELVARDVLTLGLGPLAGTAVAVVALGILVSSINYNFLGTPRVPYGLARDGLAPRAFLRINEGGTPTAGLYLTAGLIFVLTASGTFELLIRFMSFFTLVVDGFVLTTIFVLRRRRPDAARPFRVPGYPVVPALAVLLYASLVAVIAATQPRLAAGGALLLGGVAVAAWLLTRRARMHTGGVDTPAGSGGG